MWKTTILAILVMGSLSLPAFASGSGGESPTAAAVRSVSESRSVDPNGTVSIRTYAGTVAVKGWDKPTVQVTGTLDRDIVRLDFSTSNGGTTIETVPPNRDRITSKMRLESELEVMVPAGSSVRISSLGADVTVRGITGTLDCDTLGGSIDVASAPGVIALRTLSGAITLVGPARRVSFQTMGGGRSPDRAGGDVVIQGEVPEVIGSTLAGGVWIRGSTMKDYDISTLSGTVTLDGSLAEDARVKVDAGLDGSIDLVLPSDVQGKFTVTCPPSRLEMKGFTPKAEVTWVFRNDADGGGAVRPSVTVILPELPPLPRTILGGSFSEFDVGSPAKARVYLELGALGGRSSTSRISLSTR